MDQPVTCCRRHLLQAGGLILVAGPLLASCGAADSAPAATTAPDGTLRIPTSAVAVGKTSYDSEHKLIVSHPADATFIVFDSTCPHQGCAVSTVKDGQLVCPCHGSIFDAATGGLIAGPAPRGLTVKPSTVEGEEIVIGG
ncbi:MAG: Rieske (2Fe-2S) protein [Ornithinimicrobium sp.]|uniref:Rieske (2Fe-2S) protein n=1 Tax=Ornithinimicrobium sp. TaxID=1977084 RepID=UPI0026E05AC1|nr:Rieske (2Fe-2S) protein [Ornithinimicrobium sp.]MDO5738682.1 Rieske (2Fe-2S) protein [Ornithinimicrobium sp.]